MSDLPLLLRHARRDIDSKESRARDFVTGEDPLPAKVQMEEQGIVLSRDTRITKVAPETTDDN
jgi:hypothetical protein